MRNLEQLEKLSSPNSNTSNRPNRMVGNNAAVPKANNIPKVELGANAANVGNRRMTGNVPVKLNLYD